MQHPAQLASDSDPTYRLTAPLERLSRACAETVTKPRSRLVITAPPQEGLKTSLARRTITWALTNNPNLRILYVTYDTTLACSTLRIAASMAPHVLNAHSRQQWKAAHGNGDVYCTGPGSALTGRSFDLIVIDDPHRNQLEASNTTKRQRVQDWWDTVAACRLNPNGSVIVTATRFHPDDLPGTLIRDGWPEHRVPAQNPDGTYLESARGRTTEDWGQCHRHMTTAVWEALYQQQPS